MPKTYRDILKWGDKREQGIDSGTFKIIKEKFNFNEEDFKTKHLPGNNEVKLEKKSALKEDQLKHLIETAGKENVIALGDFNFRPDSEQYRLTTDILEDSWLLKWPGGNQDQGIDPAGRIDHIFVSPGIEVSDSVYLAEPESDHLAMMTTLEW